MAEVRVRFAPSPTGYLHIGGARTALFNWLFARNKGGKFILRIEDTDKERSTEESINAIIESMKWLNLDWDEGPYFQSERYEMYKKYAQELLAQDKAYKCYCTPQELREKRERAQKEKRKPKYDGTCRELKKELDKPYAIRFKTPQEGITRLNDLIRGEITFKNEELDDLIIIRSDGSPTYNFTVVIDDHDMNITHVIRGDDHLNNTPKQILFYQAFGWDIPEFAHVPLILGPDKQRLSKRHGAMSVMAYHDMGYLPQAVVNYLVRLGWAHEDQEIFTIDELVEKFSLKGLGKSPSVFNIEKMTWVSGQHMKMTNTESLKKLVLPFLQDLGFSAKPDDKLSLLIDACKERSKTLVALAEWMTFYYSDSIEYDPKGAKKFLNLKGAEVLKILEKELSSLDKINNEIIEKIFERITEKLNVRMVEAAQTARMALTGKTVSPGIFEVINILGKERTIHRIQDAIAFIEAEI